MMLDLDVVLMPEPKAKAARDVIEKKKEEKSKRIQGERNGRLLDVLLLVLRLLLPRGRRLGL
jgi:hypothetical protein